MKHGYLFGLFVLATLIFIGCEKDKPISNITLLTNNSSKTWYKIATITNEMVTVESPTCISDDEYIFIVDGTLLLKNMGTFLKVTDMNKIPPHCTDTLKITYTHNWSLNKAMDTLTINYYLFTLRGRILKLTYDSLIIKYPVNDSWVQTNIYVTRD